MQEPKKHRVFLSPEGSLVGPGDKVPSPDGWSMASNETRQMIAVWRELRRQTTVPRLKDLDRSKIAQLLPSLLVVDVLPETHDYRYREAGALEIEVRGYDPTGKTLRELYVGDVLAFVLENYDLARNSSEGIIDFSVEVEGNHRFIELETLFLPMSEDGETVTQILVYSHYIRK